MENPLISDVCHLPRKEKCRVFTLFLSTSRGRSTLPTKGEGSLTQIKHTMIDTGATEVGVVWLG